ncbi:hypothetical protein M0805_000708 [Coniferiporia weirii]|nr:hypothetical protein M0805_000708 [Coniferiporia weirii]
MPSLHLTPSSTSPTTSTVRTQRMHHLTDLYELIQYANNIVPHLYLMITVSAVYMSIPEAPVKEIMEDMMEMSCSMQHPTRGLFLHHYLSGQMKGTCPTPAPSLSRSDGCLTPFLPLQPSRKPAGFNRVRAHQLHRDEQALVQLQHQGHLRNRKKHEMERRELCILVGTNLSRLSTLDGVNLGMYQRTILPSILEHVVNCKDVITQEYLIQVVIQVFTDEFHLYSLGPFPSTTAQLQQSVNIKQIVITLINRLAVYAAREAENENPEETKRQEEAAARRLVEEVKAQKAKAWANSMGLASATPVSEDVIWASTSPTSADAEKSFMDLSLSNEEAMLNGKNSPTEEKGKEKEREAAPLEKFRGIPENIKPFELFWHQVVELIKARPDLSIQDITALLVPLMNLSFSCYPDHLEYVDQILGFTSEKIKEFSDSPDLHTMQTTNNLASLLIAPISSYQSVLTLLTLPRYANLLLLQPFTMRCSLTHAIIITWWQARLGLGRASAPAHADHGKMVGEQGWVARMVHLFRTDAFDVQFELFQEVRRHFEAGGEREMILKFTCQLISILFTQVEAPAIALRLFLFTAQVSDECGFEDLTYDMYIWAFTMYKDSISDSRVQLQAVTVLVGMLQSVHVFCTDNYDTLFMKAVLYAVKLLKKSHQIKLFLIRMRPFKADILLLNKQTNNLDLINVAWSEDWHLHHCIAQFWLP